MYADFVYYRDTYHGCAIAEADFPRLEHRAREQVDRLTRYRAARYAESMDSGPVSDAVCAIAEVLQQGEQAGAPTGPDSKSRVVKSATTGKAREDYAVFHAANSAGQNYLHRQIAKAAQLHLYKTGLLHRGVDMC